MCKSIEIIRFKNAIENFVADSPLPDEVKRMVLSECLDKQTQRTLETVRREIAEGEKEGENHAD